MVDFAFFEFCRSFLCGRSALSGLVGWLVGGWNWRVRVGVGVSGELPVLVIGCLSRLSFSSSYSSFLPFILIVSLLLFLFLFIVSIFFYFSFHFRADQPLGGMKLSPAIRRGIDETMKQMQRGAEEQAVTEAMARYYNV